MSFAGLIEIIKEPLRLTYIKIKIRNSRSMFQDLSELRPN